MKAVAARMTKSLSVVRVRTSPELVPRSNRTCLKIDSVHVKRTPITEVQCDQDATRMLRVGQDILRPHATEGRQIAYITGVPGMQSAGIILCCEYRGTIAHTTAPPHFGGTTARVQ